MKLSLISGAKSTVPPPHHRDFTANVRQTCDIAKLIHPQMSSQIIKWTRRGFYLIDLSVDLKISLFLHNNLERMSNQLILSSAMIRLDFYEPT